VLVQVACGLQSPLLWAHVSTAENNPQTSFYFKVQFILISDNNFKIMTDRDKLSSELFFHLSPFSPDGYQTRNHRLKLAKQCARLDPGNTSSANEWSTNGKVYLNT